MVGHGGSSAGSYLADPTSPIPSHCASIVATSTLRVKNHRSHKVSRLAFQYVTCSMFTWLLNFQIRNCLLEATDHVSFLFTRQDNVKSHQECIISYFRDELDHRQLSATKKFTHSLRARYWKHGVGCNNDFVIVLAVKKQKVRQNIISETISICYNARKRQNIIRETISICYNAR